MENPIKMDDLGVPLFSETSINIYIHIYCIIYYICTYLIYLYDRHVLLLHGFYGTSQKKTLTPQIPSMGSESDD